MSENLHEVVLDEEHQVDTHELNLQEVIVFEDQKLKEAVLKTVKKQPHEDVTLEDIQTKIPETLFLEGLGITSLKGLERAKFARLTLSKNNVTDLSPIASVEGLKYILANENQINSLECLSSLSGTLVTLWIGSNPITSLAGLENCALLESVNAENCEQLTDISALERCAKLKGLHLTNTKVNNIDCLIGATNMENLSLMNTKVTNIDVLKKFKKLKTLNLVDLNLGNECLSVLEGNTTLTDLRLNGNNITDISPLASLPETVRNVALSYNHIKDVSVLKPVKDRTGQVFVVGQTIELERKEVFGNKVSIKNPIIGFDGQPVIPNTISNGGKAEGGNIVWEDIPVVSGLTFGFAIDGFRGTVNLPLEMKPLTSEDGDINGDGEILETEKIENVESIGSKNNTSVVLTKTGRVYACGDNSYGQLGLGMKTEIFNLQNVPVENIASMVLSGTHTFFITKENKVFVTGRNYEGQLGLGHYDDVFKPVELKIEDVKEFVMNSHDTFAIKNDGTVYATGSNYRGELGVGHLHTVCEFTKVPIENVEKIVTTDKNTMFFLKSGEVYGCGDNRHGQLGIGVKHYGYQTTPVKVRVKMTPAE